MRRVMEERCRRLGRQQVPALMGTVGLVTDRTGTFLRLEAAEPQHGFVCMSIRFEPNQADGVKAEIS